jgi:two-component system, cell cycle sensor histidine kinase and response regulator CckA
VLRVGRDGHIRYSNPAAAVVVEDQDFCRDRTLTDEWRALTVQTMGRGTPARFERQLGRSIFQFTVAPVVDRDYVNIYGNDVTDKRMIERMLLQSSKMEAMGSLAGGVAHEFNNMMTVVNAYSDILILKLADNAPLLSYATRIKETGKKATSITDQLLVFARKNPTKLESVDVAAALGGLEEMLRPIVGKHLGFTVKSEPTIGHVRMDPVQIDQLIVNLVINARDALNEGGSIRVEADNREIDSAYQSQHFPLTPGRYIAIRVVDTGAGIAPEIVERVFEPFFTTKDVGKGTGLGLAVVYKIVKDSMGDIRISSEPGIGTTFEILLRRDETGRTRPLNAEEMNIQRISRNRTEGGPADETDTID